MKKALAVLIVAFLVITLAGCSFNLFEEPATGPAASSSTPAASSTPASDPNSEPTSTPTSTPPPQPEMPEITSWLQESAAFGDGQYETPIFLTEWQKYAIETDESGNPIPETNQFPEPSVEAAIAYLLGFPRSMSGFLAAIELNARYSGVYTDKIFKDLIQEVLDGEGYEANQAGRDLFYDYVAAVMSDRCEVQLVWVTRDMVKELYNSYNAYGVAFYYPLSYNGNMTAWKVTWYDEDGKPFLDEDGDPISTYQLIRCGNPLSSEPPPDRITPPPTTPPPPPPPPPAESDPPKRPRLDPAPQGEAPIGENPNDNSGKGVPQPVHPGDPPPSYTQPAPPPDTTPPGGTSQPPASSSPPAATPAPPPAMPAEPAPTQPGAGENNGSLALPPP